MSNRKNWPLALSVGPAVIIDDEKLDALAAAGINQVELSSGAWEPYIEKLDFVNNSMAIAENAKAHGVSITSIHLPFAPFNEIDPAYEKCREMFMEVQKTLLEAAAKAGIPIAVVHPSGEPYSEEERPDRLNCACEAIDELCAFANELGIQLALENLPRTCLCREHRDMEYFLERIPNLKVCFDMNHNLSEDNLDYIRAVADRIITLHVSDYDRIDERHWLPGKGVNPWEEIICLLEESDYQGRFLYELAAGQGTYEEIAANYRRLMKCMEMSEIIEPFTKVQGVSGVYFEDLLTGETAGFGEHTPMSAASVIKLPIMMTLMEMADKGEIDLSEKVKVGTITKVPSCGVIAYMHPEAEVTIQDICTAMIIVSDNTATNWMIDKVGMDKVNDYMQRHGCLHSALRRKMFDRAASLRGLTNHVTAYDMAQLLRQIYNKEVPGAEQMLEILRNQQLNGKIPVGLRGLAGEEDCAHKTGEDDDITHDVGIVLTDKPFIICFLTNQSPDVTEAEYAMHRIVRDLMLNRE